MRGLLYHTSVSSVDRSYNICGANSLPYSGHNLVAGVEKDTLRYSTIPVG